MMNDMTMRKKRKGVSQATEMLVASSGMPTNNQLLATQFQTFVSAVSYLRN